MLTLSPIEVGPPRVGCLGHQIHQGRLVGTTMPAVAARLADRWEPIDSGRHATAVG